MDVLNRRRLDLGCVTNISLEDMIREPSRHNRPCLFVTASGYEERSVRFAEVTSQAGIWPSDPISALVYEIIEYEGLHYKPSSNRFYQSIGVAFVKISSQDARLFITHLTKRVKTFREQYNGMPIDIHVDYSSMPRSWYCRVPIALAEVISSEDTITMWYTPGRYKHTTFQSGGIASLNVFCGRASITARDRTHFVGLGFDPIRTGALLVELDPSTVVSYYADPAFTEDYASEVVKLNQGILAASSHVIKLPLTNFAKCFADLRGAVIEYLQYGNVVLVPEGPKPIILATSLLPLTLGRSVCPKSVDDYGAICIHVGRRKGDDYIPPDVSALADPVGHNFKAQIASC